MLKGHDNIENTQKLTRDFYRLLLRSTVGTGVVIECNDGTLYKRHGRLTAVDLEAVTLGNKDLISLAAIKSIQRLSHYGMPGPKVYDQSVFTLSHFKRE
jgi:hypothetical protein